MDTEPEPLKRKIKRGPDAPRTESDDAQAVRNGAASSILTTPGIARPQRDPLVRPLFVCIVCGIVSDFLIRSPGIWAIFGIAGTILATMAYPIWGHLREVHRHPSLRERLADNSYYLGFIITQVSLLVGFGWPALSGAKITSTEVLQFFGVAVGASMIGLIARTLLVQTGHTVSESADIVHGEVERLSREVSSLAGGVASTTRDILTELQGTLAAFKASRSAIDESVGGWSDSVARSLRNYQELVDQQAAAVNRGTRVADTVSSQLEVAANSGVNELTSGIQAFREAIERLQRDVSAVTGGTVKAILDNTEKLGEATNTARSIQGTANASLQQITADIRTAAKNMEQGLGAMRALGLLQTKVDTLGAEIDQRIAAGSSAISGMSSRADKFRSDLDEAVRAFNSVLEDFRKELSESGD